MYVKYMQDDIPVLDKKAEIKPGQPNPLNLISQVDVYGCG